ncbi:cyclase family protein [Tenacibaculum xiamenense]|uniref:cyclase family protein n=1 Tax=Tenacibaculum xiamenense TaxID=1261553 RepID=UPI0038B4A809
MKASIEYNKQQYTIDLSKPLDISIPIDLSKQCLNAWYIDDPKISPVVLGDWTGSVEQGADVNFNNIAFNPHAHITHTECVGHITKEFYSINKKLSKFFFLAEVVSVTPEKIDNGDFIITKDAIKSFIHSKELEAIVIRTLPNTDKKKTTRYSNTNPPYLLQEAAEYLKEKGVKHLLIDLPSVDKEQDEGKLLSHNAFWNTQEEIRFDATITEFIYVPSSINDGTYLLNLMVAPFENDATPSKPILYKIL